MARIFVAILLGMILIVAGFAVIDRWTEGKNAIVLAGNDIECKRGGGVCIPIADTCTSPIDVSCGDEFKCCKEQNLA